MLTQNRNNIKSIMKLLSTGSVFLFSAMTLTGCYVDVDPTPGYPDHYSGSKITDFKTDFLVEAALVPFALSAESPNMVSDPDAYTTPNTRTATRAVVTDTSYSHLLDNRNCDYSGSTKIDARADTTSYNDGYTYVDFHMNAQAFDCKVRNRGTLHRINSNLNYDATGWYDDITHEIRSMSADLTGNVNVEYSGNFLSHTSMAYTTASLSASDYEITGASFIQLDDGYHLKQVRLTTSSAVHYYLGANHPHSGRVHIQHSGSSVQLTFESNGVWRRDNGGRERYTSWSSLGF